MHAGPDDRRHQELLPEVPAPQPNLSPAPNAPELEPDFNELLTSPRLSARGSELVSGGRSDTQILKSYQRSPVYTFHFQEPQPRGFCLQAEEVKETLGDN